MSQKTNTPFKILFLCTGNSARSIIAEYTMQRIGKGRFESYSAGAQPSGTVHPFAIEFLKNINIDASDASSKSWDEFKDIQFDFVITVCDNAKESCPVWPGQPVIAHWGSEDPAAAGGSDKDKRRVFKRVGIEIQRRIELFCSLPLEKMDKLKLQEVTSDIGNGEPVNA
ncbi:MAG: arsenate reductase ArsC [Verrucomicrobiota bacterium]